MDFDEAREQYFQQGYFVVDDAVDPAMLDRLEGAGRRVVDLVRSGQVDVSGQGPLATGVISLIDPRFGERAMLTEPFDHFNALGRPRRRSTV